MSKGSYRRYLMSEDWRERRKELLEEANYECEECGEKATVIHHLKYDNLGEEELGEDVMVLCKECHEDKHLEDGKDTYGEYGEY